MYMHCRNKQMNMYKCVTSTYRSCFIYTRTQGYQFGSTTCKTDIYIYVYKYVVANEIISIRLKLEAITNKI